MINEQEKYRALNDARDKEKQEKAEKNSLKNNAEKSIKNLAKNATPLGMLSLFSQINISDWVYALAFVAAVAKDFLDFIEATGVLYALVIVATFMCSLFIAMMMILGGSSGVRKTQKKVIQKWLTLLGGTTAEIIFGVNIIPIETLTVIVIYWMVLSGRKEEASENRETGLAPQEG